MNEQQDNQSPVMTTDEYARLMGVTVRTLTAMWRRGDKCVAQPINQSAYKGYRFNRASVIRKLKGR